MGYWCYMVSDLSLDAASMLSDCAGCIAGPNGCIIKLQDAIKKPWPDVPIPLMTAVSSEADATGA